MATCPSGHESASDDFCDICGMRIGLPTLSSVDAGVSLGAGAPTPTVNVDDAAAPQCPRCGSPRDGQFCEDCGWNFADGTGPEVPASWHGASWHDPPAPPPADPPAPDSAPSPAAPSPALPSPDALPSPATPPSPAPPSPVPPSSSRPGLRGTWSDLPPSQSYAPPASRSYAPPQPPPAPAAPPEQSYAPPAPAAPAQPPPGSAQPPPAPAQSAPPAQDPPAPPAAPAWSATVTADRDYFDAVLAASGMDAADIDFPAYCPDRRFRLSGSEVRIGRRSVSRGITPEIDLSGPPSDPGVSRLHAVLIAGPDGTWSVLDPGSANGTLLNGNEIHPNEQVKLREGDRINLGAWTVLIVSRDN